MINCVHGLWHAICKHMIILALFAKYQVTASMTGRGNGYDNAVMERFFLNLEMERVWQRHYANHLDANRDMGDYIVAFYNQQR